MTWQTAEEHQKQARRRAGHDHQGLGRQAGRALILPELIQHRHVQSGNPGDLQINQRPE